MTARQVTDARLGALWFDAADEVIAPVVASRGIWEPLEGLWLDLHVRPGMRVVNVGANVGYFTLWAAGLVGNAGQVIAVEPHPGNLELLRRNVADRNLHQVRIVAAAAGAIAMPLTLYVNHRNPGDHRVFDPALTSTRSAHADQIPDMFLAAPSAIQVDGTTVDGLVGDDLVDVLFTDTQGFDHQVLRGAAHVMLRDRPVAMMEFVPSWISAQGEDPAQVLAELEALDYRIGLWDPGVAPGTWSRERIVDWTARRWFTNLEFWPVERPLTRRVRPAAGFAPLERTPGVDRYWLVRPNGQVRLAGPAGTSARLTLTLLPPPGGTAIGHVGDTAFHVATPTLVEIPVVLDGTGQCLLPVMCESEPVRVKGDPRPLHVGIRNPRLTSDDLA